MAGTQAGGIAAAKTVKTRDSDFYARIGAMGGRNGHIGGFNKPGVASRAGKIGGRLSRRTYTAKQ